MHSKAFGAGSGSSGSRRADLRQYAQTEGRLAGVYIPFWTYDSDTTTSYVGERGDYYYTTESYVTVEQGRSVRRTRQVRHTRWSPASGTVWNNFDDILILASKSLPREYAGKLEPWDLDNLVPYTDEYLSGFRAESYQISLPEGFEEAKKAMAGAIQSSIRQDIGGDEQRIHSAETQYGSITFKHILLPVWLSAYRFREKSTAYSSTHAPEKCRGSAPSVPGRSPAQFCLSSSPSACCFFWDPDSRSDRSCKINRE